MALNHLTATAQSLSDALLVVNRDTYRDLAVNSHQMADSVEARYRAEDLPAVRAHRADAEMFAATADVFSQVILDRAKARQTATFMEAYTR